MINKIIQTEEEYQQALSDLELLMAAAPGSKEVSRVGSVAEPTELIF